MRASIANPTVPDGVEYCLLSSATTLATATKGSVEHSVVAAAKSTFVFEFTDTSVCEGLFPDLRVRRERPNGDVAISCERPEFCGPMSGIRFSSSRSGEERVFDISANTATYEILATYSGAPVLVKTAGAVYLTTGAIDIDLSAPVSGNYFDIKQYWPGTLAVAMYLQWAFKGDAWAPHEHNASLIIDDPLLKSRYGFLVFQDVLHLMQQHNFSTTIAFIPWNWRRTRTKTAELFLHHPERYSLAFHGNDHTRGEFGSRSVEVLDRMIKMAVKRMDAHEARTGIVTPRVMVFPQGVFSAESLEALKHNNFVAAVNTEVGPSGDDAPRTEIGELWSTAIMKFSSFALFTRRYMEHGIENFAFDLLLGKPCLLVGHHEVFKDGAEQLVDFVRRLNSLNCSLRWRGLADAVQRSYRERKDADDTMHVQMFGNEIVFETKGATTVHVSKQESATVQNVSQNGRAITWKKEVDAIHFSIDASPGAAVRIVSDYADKPAAEVASEGLSYRIKCRLRRYMSEVRDDYVSRSSFASTLLRGLR
jgi:hypothetical protein